MTINKILASKKHIKLNNKTTYIEYEQFKDNKILENIDLDNGKLAKISYAAFEDCTSLETVRLGEGCTYIMDDVFANCLKLKKIYLPSTIYDFPPSALKNCPELNEIIIPKNLNFDFNCMPKNIKITKVDYNTINEYYNSLDFLLQENKSIKEINKIYKEQKIEK